MSADTGRLRYMGLLIGLVVCASLLAVRLIYLFLADANRFPINTVKIVASYHHITHKQLEKVLSDHMNKSFFSLPVRQLYTDLAALDWSDQINIERIWPDTLKITLVEKKPVAVWNNFLVTKDGKLFNARGAAIDESLLRLSGPANQKKNVLQIYQKLSKILSKYGLHAASLQLRDNHAWELSLVNGVKLRLGKRDLEKRLLRFCKAYPAVFADKPGQLASVDLRYPRGMAVQWQQ